MPPHLNHNHSKYLNYTFPIKSESKNYTFRNTPHRICIGISGIAVWKIIGKTDKMRPFLIGKTEKINENSLEKRI